MLQVWGAQLMAQGYKHDSITFPELCEHIYHAFGQYAVISFIEERQSAGYLSDVIWQNCLGCDYKMPFYKLICLVCGGK